MCAYGQDFVGRSWHAWCEECDPTPPTRPQMHRELTTWEKEEREIDPEQTAIRCNTCGAIQVLDDRSSGPGDVDGPQSQLATKGRVA